MEYLKYKNNIKLKLSLSNPKFPCFLPIKLELNSVNIYQISNFLRVITKIRIKKELEKKKVMNFFDNMVLFFKTTYKINLLNPCYLIENDLELFVSIPRNSFNYHKIINSNQKYRVVLNFYNIFKSLDNYVLNIKLYYLEDIN
tara:strand:- start:217 stop:645 length:429 start_codon:yes stop_codon:yes gene_type:complete